MQITKEDVAELMADLSQSLACGWPGLDEAARMAGVSRAQMLCHALTMFEGGLITSGEDRTAAYAVRGIDIAGLCRTEGIAYVDGFWVVSPAIADVPRALH